MKRTNPIDSSVAPFECTSKWPARVSLGRVFLFPCPVFGIDKNGKLNASCAVVKVDITVSDVISTLRTRII